MELFTTLFSDLLVFVYHCFDRIVIHGYLSGLSRPEQVVHFLRQVVGVETVDEEVLSRRTGEYQDWVEAFARNHKLPIQWAEKGVRKEDYVQPWLRRMVRKDVYGVYFTVHDCVSQATKHAVDVCDDIKGVGVNGTGWTSPGGITHNQNA